jgi:tetratricopeptide (TPR) repeat protein
MPHDVPEPGWQPPDSTWQFPDDRGPPGVAGTRDNAGVSQFVGRAEPLARLGAVYRTVADAPGGRGAHRAGLVLVAGEAGIGKTALLTRFTTEVEALGATVIWGTCWAGDQAPAWWPWTQALRSLLHRRPDLCATIDPAVAAVVPDVGPAPGAVDRLKIFDAVGALLARAGADAPVAVVLDDLQWADRSSVELLQFLARHSRPGALVQVGAYRPGERHADVAPSLAELATAAELVVLRGLSPAEVADLVAAVAGGPVADRWATLVHERSGGHPFFARELCRLLSAGPESTAGQVAAAGPAAAGSAGAGGAAPIDAAAADVVPAAVRDAIERRLVRLPTDCRALLDAAAVAGRALQPDVLADVCGDDAATVAERMAPALDLGILEPVAGEAAVARFAHDLYRETIYTALGRAHRQDLHHRAATALVRRHERGGFVFPADLARHFAAAVTLAGPAPALTWARTAAEADTARFAFAEAAGHLARVRSAVAGAGRRLSDASVVCLLVDEADLRLRSGDAAQARALLDTAWARAAATGAADLLSTVALGLDRVGARFAMPRTELISVLETARAASAGAGTPAAAQVTAALARHLQHSVSADRPRARPLADAAVRIARRLDDPNTLASCLLAQHDTLWTPGRATQRAAIAAEIGELAKRTADHERHAQALLLAATAQLENGSAAFRASLTEFGYVTERLRQPRHDYMLRTRQAALALLDGDIEAGDRLSQEATALGEAVGDSDTGNVRMSQRLEIARARADRAELRALAEAAVRWWVGAPAHAHAVAAGFFARAGDLDAARRHLDTVLALDEWRTDRSYLWSVFVGELATAAIALDDRPLCTALLADLLPLADTCAVNGALVCFMGAHAHRVGLLHAALGEPEPAARWLNRALETHRRLGARAWEAETRAALDSLHGGGPTPATDPDDAAPRLVRAGDVWQVSYRGRSAFVADVKGVHDLAALLARPGTDLPALDLAGGGLADGARAADPVLDRAALAAYKRRLAELDDELSTAGAQSDLARRQRATDEREHLLAELRRATRPDGGSRRLGPSAAERARKAVTARIRDAIRRVGAVLPDLGTHLDRSIRTGTVCRYDPRS